MAVEQIKKVSAKGDLDEGIEAEKGGFVTAFGSEDAREGIWGVSRQAEAEVERQVRGGRRTSAALGGGGRRTPASLGGGGRRTPASLAALAGIHAG